MIQNEMETFRHRLLKLDRRLRGDVGTLADEAFHEADGNARNLSNIPVEDRAELGSDKLLRGSDNWPVRERERAAVGNQRCPAAHRRWDLRSLRRVRPGNLEHQAPDHPLCTAVHRVRPQGTTRGSSVTEQPVGICADFKRRSDPVKRLPRRLPCLSICERKQAERF